MSMSVNKLWIESKQGGYLLDSESFVTIGSSPNADFRIVNSYGVAGNHAQFVRKVQSWSIEPIDGQVLLNGEQVEEREVIAIGDEIQIGDSILIVKKQVNSSPLPSPPPPIPKHFPPPIPKSPPSPIPAPPPPIPGSGSFNTSGTNPPSPIYGSGGSSFTSASPASPLSPLPPGFKNPLVEGEVENVDVSEIEENHHWLCQLIKFFISIILFFIKPLMFLMSLAGGGHQIRNRTKIYRIRLKLGGRYQEVIARGDLEEAGVTMGDFISVWGFKKGGIIEMTKGYNHTVCARIIVKK
jgi:FHA domain